MSLELAAGAQRRLRPDLRHLARAAD